MPLTKKYKYTWSSSSGASKDNRAPANAYEYDSIKRSWKLRRGSTATGGDAVIDVSDATSIFVHADLLNSTNSSTSVVVKIHTSPGSTGDIGLTSTSILNWTTSGSPYTSITLSTASATGPLAQDAIAITPGMHYMKFRADSSSSGGYANEGLRVTVNLQFGYQG